MSGGRRHTVRASWLPPLEVNPMSTSLTVADGKTVTFNKTVTFTSAGDSGVLTLPNGTATIPSTGDNLSAFATTTSAQLAGVISDETGSGSLVFGTAPTITTINLSGGQIAFPATQSPSSSANTLDDYAEGTWTPVMAGSGGTSGQSYSIQSGHYVKIGQFVMVTGRMVLSNKGTITGFVQIEGLPFTVLSNSAPACVFATFQNMATTWLTLGGYAAGTQINVSGIQSAGSGTVGLTTTDISNTTEWWIQVSYRASA